jgi:hypothetical protein
MCYAAPRHTNCVRAATENIRTTGDSFYSTMPKYKTTSTKTARRLARALQIAMALQFCGLLAACGGGSSPAVITAITIVTAQSSVPVSGVASFTASATDKNGRAIFGATLTFASSATNVAAVTGAR